MSYCIVFASTYDTADRSNRRAITSKVTECSEAEFRVEKRINRPFVRREENKRKSRIGDSEVDINQGIL